MADYDPAWGQRMMQRYGATEADLADPDQRRNLNRRAREDAAAAASPAAPPAPTAPAPAAPQTGGAETKPTTGGTIPNQPGQYGGINPYGYPPPASGYGYAVGGYYGGPGTTQPRRPAYGGYGGYRPPRAGYPGAANYPQPGNTYPLTGYGPGARPGFQGYGQPGPPPMVDPSNMNQPPPGAAYDALAARRG